MTVECYGHLLRLRMFHIIHEQNHCLRYIPMFSLISFINLFRGFGPRKSATPLHTTSYYTWWRFWSFTTVPVLELDSALIQQLNLKWQKKSGN